MKIFGVEISAKEKVVNFVFWSAVGYTTFKIVKATMTSEQKKKLDFTSMENFFAKPVDDLYKFLTGSNDSIGGDIYDGVQNIKKIFSPPEILVPTPEKYKYQSKDGDDYDVDYNPWVTNIQTQFDILN